MYTVDLFRDTFLRSHQLTYQLIIINILIVLLLLIKKEGFKNHKYLKCISTPHNIKTEKWPTQKKTGLYSKQYLLLVFKTISSGIPKSDLVFRCLPFQNLIHNS